MSHTSICIKSVNELLGNSFLIPAYQRGYRWTGLQVRELLEDVLAFQKSEEGRSRDGFYCLQPIVVKSGDLRDDWEVVDGQQRLTTVFLILQFFNERLTEKHRRKLYSLDFETRHSSKEYLLEPTGDRSNENIDFHFIFRAKTTIEGWFADKDNLVNDFEAALLNRVKIIWYQLPSADKAVDAFTRLNVGKIPLTTSELVRALFLRSKNFPQTTANLKQVKIAQEWDAMEKSLQDESFWCFLTDDKNTPNRIELLFDLIAAATPGVARPSSDGYNSFHYFNEMLDGSKTADDLWDDVKQLFMTLDEWHRDTKLFHLIGYLINEGESVLALLKMSKNTAKRKFRTILKQRIFDILFSRQLSTYEDKEKLAEFLSGFLDDLTYGPDSGRIKSILLLFNIASIIADPRSIVRFRFDYFKRESWDIEHIRSVDSARPTANVDKRPWLETVRDYFEETGENQELRDRANTMLNSRGYTTGDAFDQLYDDLISHFGEQESTEAENGIGNLALLDSGTNRGFRNAVFPIKRKRLLQHDQAGVFVPLCTRNAFLKCYSTKTENMFFWSVDDQRDYRKAMATILADFFTTSAST